MRWRVAQVGGDMRIFVRSSENVEMGVAGISGRRVCGFKAVVWVWLYRGHL
jgi:hypothetical protein